MSHRNINIYKGYVFLYAMTIHDIISDKLKYFCQQQIKVHITKIPTIKYPKGKFHNGLILDILKDKILFNDNIENDIEILRFDISDVEAFTLPQRGVHYDSN